MSKKKRNKSQTQDVTQQQPQAQTIKKRKRVAGLRQYALERNPNIERAPGASSSAVHRVPSDLQAIRALARHLVHTNVYAKRAVSIRTSHFVGSGIRFHISGNERYNRAFQDWASSFACDYENRKTLYGIQQALVRSENEAGEGVVIMRDVIDSETGMITLKLQAIDPDMIAHAQREPHNAGALVKSGVEHDDDGRVLGYHFKRNADDDGLGASRDTFYVDADDVIHFFDPLYPGQLRGIPRATQVSAMTEMIKVYMNTSSTKAYIEACSTVFIKRQAGDDVGAWAGGSDDDDGVDAQGGAYPLDYISPGLVWYLNDGEEVQSINPSSGGSFEPFVRISLEAIATGFDVTYSQLSGDLSRVNFSSEKAGRLEFNRGIESLRSITFEPLMRRIEQRFRETYILNREEPEYHNHGARHEEVECDDMSCVEVTLIPPARERIEPQKEALVEVIELQTGALTWRQYILSRGKDPDLQMKEIIEEREQLSKLGINLMFGSFQTNVDALAESVSREDAQNAIEDNATMFDRRKNYQYQPDVRFFPN